MVIHELDAIYENGLLRPLEPLALGESQRVRITVSDTPSSGAAVQGLIDQNLLDAVRAEVSGMQRHPTIDDVREALATIKGSMSEAVSAERGDY